MGGVSTVVMRGLARAMLAWAAAMPVAAGAWPWSKPVEKQVRDSLDQPAPAPAQAAADTFTATFLDTLNRGREVGLAGTDVTPAAAVLMDSTGARQAPQALPPAFRVQCLASSQVEMVRAERRNLEAKTRHPVYIVSSPPYFKLLVGDFADRSAAERALAELRGLGYPDAWIVAGKPQPKP